MPHILLLKDDLQTITTDLEYSLILTYIYQLKVVETTVLKTLFIRNDDNLKYKQLVVNGSSHNEVVTMTDPKRLVSFVSRPRKAI